MSRNHKPVKGFRVSRRTLQMQLTLLYAVPFFVSGAALLSIPLLGVRETVPVAGQGGASPSPGRPHIVAPDHLLTASVIGLAALVLVSFGLGWVIAGRFLRPLRTITAAAREISASNLHRRLGLRHRSDEFRELAETLDDLFGRLEASFESQRHFVANASHELRTPLTAERALLQVALADPEASDQTLRLACQDVLALGEQQERLIEALLMLASSERGIEHREPFDLAEITRRGVLVRREEAQRRAVQVESRLESAVATGDPSLVESLVANLVDNGLRHNVAGGRIEIATGTRDGRAYLSVSNTGTVIPPDQVERLFQPFQRLGSERIHQVGGHGLGLAIVAAIAVAHGGTLTPRARPQGGLDIDVTFS